MLMNSGYISKLALFTIMLKVAEEVEKVPMDAPFFISPDSVIIVGFEELNPENMRIRFDEGRCAEVESIYKAPEVIRDGRFSEASLIWNVGIVFDELINERTFFQNETEVMDPTGNCESYSVEYKYAANHSIP